MRRRISCSVLLTVLCGSLWLGAQVNDFRPVTEAMLRTLIAPELAPEIRRPNSGNAVLVFALPGDSGSKGAAAR